MSGRYFVKGKPVPPSPLGRDDDLAERLWALSEALCQRSDS